MLPSSLALRIKDKGLYSNCTCRTN